LPDGQSGNKRSIFQHLQTPIDIHLSATVLCFPSPPALTLWQQRPIVLALRLQLVKRQPRVQPTPGPRISRLSRPAMPLLPLLFDVAPLGASPG
jgi:hypothetical protein